MKVTEQTSQSEVKWRLETTYPESALRVDSIHFRNKPMHCMVNTGALLASCSYTLYSCISVGMMPGWRYQATLSSPSNAIRRKSTLIGHCRWELSPSTHTHTHTPPATARVHQPCEPHLSSITYPQLSSSTSLSRCFCLTKSYAMKQRTLCHLSLAKYRLLQCFILQIPNTNIQLQYF